MAEEKAVPYKSVGPGTNILQGRGGQAIIQDIVGNIFLTTQNNTGSNQRVLSVNDSISSIAILSGEAPVSIGTEINLPSRNFNTINYEQVPIGGVQVIQPIRNVTTQPLNIVVDLPPTTPTSTPTPSVVQQTEEQLTPIEEQILFLPDNETGVFSVITSASIEGIQLDEFKFLPLGLEVLITTINGKVQTSSGCSTVYSNLPFTTSVTPTLLTYNDAKIYLKSKYSNSIAKAVFAIIWAESSKSGIAFRSPGGFNYAGVQTDNARWSAPGIIGQFCTRDKERLRAFAIFESNNSFLDFIANRVKAKNINGDNAEKWAANYLNSWVYFDLEKQNPTLFRNTLPDKISIYRTALKRFES